MCVRGSLGGRWLGAGGRGDEERDGIQPCEQWFQVPGEVLEAKPCTRQKWPLCPQGSGGRGKKKSVAQAGTRVIVVPKRETQAALAPRHRGHGGVDSALEFGACSLCVM